MINLAIIFPVTILAFFIGFYLNLLVKILVDMLNLLHRSVGKQEADRQQEQLNQQVQTPVSHTEFIEPQTLAEYQAQLDEERIAARNQR